MPASKKVLSYMGFAAKARKIAWGYNTTIFNIEKKIAKLVIIAEDISENSKKKIISKAETNSVPYRVYGLSDEMSIITGKSGKSIFCILDENFKKAILNEIDIDSQEKEGY